MRPVTPFMMMPMRWDFISRGGIIFFREEFLGWARKPGLHVVPVGLHDIRQKFVLAVAPEAVGEDLHLIEALEASGLHPRANLPKRYAAFPHQPAVIEHVDRRSAPVAEMVGEERA